MRELRDNVALAFKLCNEQRECIKGLEDRMNAYEKVINAARLFCESTMAEMDELEGTQSASAPAEFMLLHEAVQEFDKAR